MKMIEGRIDEKSPITIVPTYNKGIAPKAVLDNVPIGNTFVNVSQGIDQEVSVVFLYDLLCLDAYGGRRSTQFLVSPETGLEVVQLFGPSVAWSRFGWTLTMELLARSILRMSEL
jgi:hypothetical protein